MIRTNPLVFAVALAQHRVTISREREFAGKAPDFESLRNLKHDDGHEMPKRRHLLMSRPP
jgi:hypothetical protein